MPVEEDREGEPGGVLEGDRHQVKTMVWRIAGPNVGSSQDLSEVVPAGERRVALRRTTGRCSRAGSGRGCGRADRRRTRRGRRPAGRRSAERGERGCCAAAGAGAAVPCPGACGRPRHAAGARRGRSTRAMVMPGSLLRAGRVSRVAAAASTGPCPGRPAGLLPPDSADWTAVHIGWEIVGYFVPRPPLVRPRAAATAVTHGSSFGFCWHLLALHRGVGRRRTAWCRWPAGSSSLVRHVDDLLADVVAARCPSARAR